MSNKVCPACKGSIRSRKNGTCPLCGEALENVGGKLYRTSERGCSRTIYELFQQLLQDKFSVQFAPRKGSKAYIKEVSFAQKLIGESAKYLAYCGHKEDIDPTEFTCKVVRAVFDSSYYGPWIAQEPSVLKCNSGVFHRIAPGVLRSIEQGAKESKTQTMFSAGGIKLGADVLALG